MQVKGSPIEERVLFLVLLTKKWSYRMKCSYVTSYAHALKISEWSMNFQVRHRLSLKIKNNHLLDSDFDLPKYLCLHYQWMNIKYSEWLKKQNIHEITCINDYKILHILICKHTNTNVQLAFYKPYDIVRFGHGQVLWRYAQT